MRASSLPGPRALPIAGRSMQLLAHFRDPVRSVTRRYEQFGAVSGLTAGDPWWVFALGADFNHQILSDTDLFHSVIFFLPASPDSSLCRLFSGLLNMNGDQHHRQRRLMLPAFQRQALASYVSTIQATLESALSSWKPGICLDIVTEMRKITFAIALRCFFGLESNEEQRIAKKLQDVLSLYTSSVVHQLPLNLPGMPYRTLLRAADDLDAAIHQVIHTKRLQDNASFDVMRVLLQARDEQGTLTENELIGHMFLLFLAGYETSATALSWTLLLLEQHPHILADLHNEIAAVLGGAHPAIDTLDRMQLLDRVIKESLRIIPPVIGFGRYATYECHVGGYTIPKGSYVSISPYLTHRSPDIYPEPNQFNPERWLSTRPSAYEYLPFGAGPRLCLGASFAILEMKIVLAVILQRYRLQIKPGSVINRQWRATLAPRPGISVTIFPQDRQFSASSIRGTIRELFHTPKQKAIK